MCRNILISMFIFPAIIFEAAWAEIKTGKLGGSIAIPIAGGEIIYRDIIGDKYGLSRSLTSINGKPALSVVGRDTFLYTLDIKSNKIFVDCAYADARNTYNGARIYAGVCGLDTELGEEYEEIAQIHSNNWRNSIFAFDTRSIFEKKTSGVFSLGKIGSIEVFDKYSSKEDVENSSPQKYIKSPSGCFNFGSAVAFLVFANSDHVNAKYLDVFNLAPAKSFHRLLEQDLIKLATETCE